MRRLNHVDKSIITLANARGKKPMELDATEIHNLFMSSPVTVDIYAALIYNERDREQLKADKVTAMEAVENIPDWILDKIIEDLCKRYVELLGEQAFNNVINIILDD